MYHRLLRVLIPAMFVSIVPPMIFANSFDYAADDLSGYNAQPGLRLSEQEAYRHTGKEVYFYLGYGIDHRFLSNRSTLLSLPGTTTTLSVIPKTSFPEQMHGIEVGFGHAWGRFVNFEVVYMQLLKTTKSSTVNGNSVRISTWINRLAGEADVIFNPDDPFRVAFKTGALVSESHDNYLVGGRTYESTESETQIDPVAGLVLSYQFTQHIEARMDVTYIADLSRKQADGEAMAALGMSYIF